MLMQSGCDFVPIMQFFSCYFTFVGSFYSLVELYICVSRTFVTYRCLLSCTFVLCTLS